ncbi:MAG: PilZ domain-containing protein [Myxococcota bacterium]
MTDGKDRRRSARHILNEPAEVHLGALTLTARVEDVSKHGMGLTLPRGTVVETGMTIWILTGKVASYAITGTVVRIVEGGRIGVAFDEILAGESLVAVESLPMTEK